ncbi:MAG: hypothetical protein HC771_10840 [Synechococcales cyanobacterium CRU_2_2]|nr:hypothetical protein [Synechococcales cyanobacterium CRU_2_2]
MHLPYHDAPSFSEPRVLRRLLDAVVAASRAVVGVGRRATLIPGLEPLSDVGLKRSLRPWLNDGWTAQGGAVAGASMLGSTLSSLAIDNLEDGGYLDQDAQQERLYRLERSLQLAYAIGDRPTIRRLETDLESLTGWRFRHHRLWLEQ